MPISSPVAVSGYSNLSTSDFATTSAAEGDGTNGYPYYSLLVWHLTRALLAIGAVCTGSSSRISGLGTTANGMSASDLWASGPHNAAYVNAWWACKITINGIQRNFVFQVGGGSNNGGLRAKMSIGVGNEFTDSGGSASATRTKAITGEGLLTPEPTFAGTDASPGFAPLALSAGSFYVSAFWDSATGYLLFEAHPAAGGTKSSPGFVFAILPLEPDSVYSTRDTHIVLISPTTLLDVTALTETSSPARAIYQCRKGIPSTAIAAVKPLYRPGIEVTSTDPGTGERLNAPISWKRDGAPVDSGGLTADALSTGQTITTPEMHDVRINANSSTRNRYLILGNAALRVPNAFVSN